MQYMFLRDLVGTINRDDQIANYEAISDALHYLNKEGQTDLDNLKMGYLKKTLTQNELRFMNWHLHKCADCRKDLKFKAVVRDGLRARKKAAEIFIEDAKAKKEQGNFKEAIKCLNEALELRPWDEEIQEKLSELLEERKPGPSVIPKDDKELMRQLSGWASSSSARMKDGTSEIPQDLEPLVKQLSILISGSLLPGKINLHQDVLMGERSFGAERGVDEEKIYMLGERISIDLGPPKDGYLTILLYDDENNVKLLFPENATDDTFVKGGEKKQFGIVAAKPLCKQYLKAFWTSDQLMVPDQIDFGDDSAIRSTIETFLSSVSALSDDDWMVFVQQFEVVKE